MSSRRAIVFYTAAAERDLESIAAYTLDVWGAEQCERYLEMLERTCERIIPQYRRFAREVTERPGFCRWRAESHLIFFRNVRGGVEIVRILHERMLPSGRL